MRAVYLSAFLLLLVLPSSFTLFMMAVAWLVLPK